jgi:hypothetical protein
LARNEKPPQENQGLPAERTGTEFSGVLPRVLGISKDTYPQSIRAKVKSKSEKVLDIDDFDAVNG